MIIVKKPKIRFKGFTETWEQRKLGDMGSTFTGLSGKSKNDFGHGNAKFVTYMNVFSNTIANLEMTDNIEIDNKQNEVKYGDVFFTTSSETPQEVGMSSVWLGNKQNIYLNSFCFGFRPSVKINEYYLAYMLRSECVRKKITYLAQGISRYNISKNKMIDIELPLTNFTEQEKIGSLFSKLDHLITLHQCKHFTNCNKNRFAWEQRKLGELLKYEQPTKYIVSSTDYSDNYKIPVLTAGQSFILGYTDETFGVKNATAESPVIIFDDFTTSSHFVDFPFKVKSSAMKILTLADCSDNIYCVNNILKNIQYVPLNHERHWISIFSDFFVKIPKDKCEQEKIGSLFSKLDNLITLHQQKCEYLKKLKKFMLQKMFPQNGENVPEIRFSNFTDTWEQRKLCDVVDRVTRKNTNLISNLPLTISAQYGLIDQNEFFDKRVASKDISGYYLINNGEFAYNKSTSVDAPWGAIKRLNRYENGVLSTLYIVFKIKNNNYVDSDFLVSYYDTNIWHKGISEIATEGARNHGLLNISPNDFFHTRLFMPCMIKEQQKIGSIFSKLDHLITLHQGKCDKLKEVKKYMLQNMFV